MCMNLWGAHVEKQSKLWSIKLWKKVGEVNKDSTTWIQNSDVTSLSLLGRLTVPLRARCIGFMSGDTLIRPELPA